MHCANSSINFSVTDTNSSRTSEAALWPSTYISPLSNSTPCIRKDRISSKSLMRLSICLWKPSIGFVPEHGTMFTLALVRFPPTATKEIQYLNAKGALTYTDIAGDPVLYGNLPPREISMKDVFRSGDSSKKFKIAEGQWYRYA